MDLTKLWACGYLNIHGQILILVHGAWMGSMPVFPTSCQPFAVSNGIYRENCYLVRSLTLGLSTSQLEINKPPIEISFQKVQRHLILYYPASDPGKVTTDKRESGHWEVFIKRASFSHPKT